MAHRLRALGAGPEILIAVCMERSPELVVGILGILKSGAAYLPLDPAYPEERKALILKDAQAPLIVCDPLTVGSFPNSSVRVVCVDTERETAAEESRADPTIPVSSRNLAYVIYTSGSTGKPKGVAIEHCSAVALLSWAKTLYTAEDLPESLLPLPSASIFQSSNFFAR